jgi:hypothetical protein
LIVTIDVDLGEGQTFRTSFFFDHSQNHQALDL